MKLNDLLQWAGTVCFMSMYTVMSFFPNLYPLNIVAGMCGSAFYLVWCIRVVNKPQTIVNSIGLLVCIAGLIKYFG